MLQTLTSITKFKQSNNHKNNVLKTKTDTVHMSDNLYIYVYQKKTYHQLNIIPQVLGTSSMETVGDPSLYSAIP